MKILNNIIKPHSAAFAIFTAFSIGKFTATKKFTLNPSEPLYNLMNSIDQWIMNNPITSTFIDLEAYSFISAADGYSGSVHYINYILTYAPIAYIILIILSMIFKVDDIAEFLNPIFTTKVIINKIPKLFSWIRNKSVSSVKNSYRSVIGGLKNFHKRVNSFATKVDTSFKRFVFNTMVGGKIIGHRIDLNQFPDN